MKLTMHHYVMPGLKMHGAIPLPLQYTVNHMWAKFIMYTL